MMMVLEITKGAKMVMESDPHGWTLSLISVSVVFTALVILYGIYSLIGVIATKKLKRQGGKPEGEVAAAIALALSRECGEGGETAAAIAMALEEELQSTVHDQESDVITITPRQAGGWNSPALNFRKSITK